jgi:hypothetical protein
MHKKTRDSIIKRRGRAMYVEKRPHGSEGGQPKRLCANKYRAVAPPTKWHRKNPGECFNAGFFRCLGYNFGICSKCNNLFPCVANLVDLPFCTMIATARFTNMCSCLRKKHLQGSIANHVAESYNRAMLRFSQTYSPLLRIGIQWCTEFT